ncbi:MAG: alpha-glucosidase/alpha-galactosidase [Clostridia bacterium]|nr:alpha-glucosidase/alpha-galactosidase [Clostridia bacterium]
MKHLGNKVEDIKIAYVGGGSRGWAWGLMSDLVSAEDISGEVRLYDIDYEASLNNAIIGNKYNDVDGAKSKWIYKAVKTLSDALTDADFVVVSILPGTFDEMESDVHAPEKYGIYQSVGDSTGPGGIVRALRTLPMIELIATAIKNYCPNAWVINYTNPMTMIMRTFYKVFPKIKAFGCCHEVFGAQRLLSAVLDENGIKDVPREEIKVNVTGVNHFTWLTKAQYKNIDLFPLYEKFVEKYGDCGYERGRDENWVKTVNTNNHRVKMDLFRRFKYIAAAGDRHLAEFCEGTWYLKNPETVDYWGFALTPVSHRKNDLKNRLEKSRKLISGEQPIALRKTGEDGVNQIRALLGLHTMVTNVNLPNVGQIPNLPLDVVVETNAVFSDDAVTPVMAGELPIEIYPLITRIIGEQEIVVESALKRDVELAFKAFVNNPLVTIGIDDAKKLYKEMLENTKRYLQEYNF